MSPLRKPAKRSRYIYETFCKILVQNTVKKPGAVIYQEVTALYPSQKAVDNFFRAIVESTEQTALERVILVALRELSLCQVKALKQCLKDHCLQGQLVEV